MDPHSIASIGFNEAHAWADRRKARDSIGEISEYIGLILVGFVVLKSAEVLAKPESSFRSRAACAFMRLLSVFTILGCLVLGMDFFMGAMSSVTRDANVSRSYTTPQSQPDPEAERKAEKNKREVEELLRKSR